MAQVNPLTRELLVKLVYYGPGLCGKTTSLQCVHRVSPPESRGQIVSLATPVDRTLYFDFLPLRLPPVRDHHVRLQLFTVPGQVYFNATRKLVLTGVDGIVFVADSQVERQDANLECMENLASNLEDQGRSLAEVPLIMQYNKRDLPNVLPIVELERSLNALGVQSFSTCATRGEGVLDALDGLVQVVLRDLEARNVLGAPTAPSTEPRFERAEEALDEQIGRASEEIWRDRAERPTEAIAAPSIQPRVSMDPIPVAPPGTGGAGPSWVALFSEDAPLIRALEEDIAAGRLSDAVIRCEELATAILTHAAHQAGISAQFVESALVAPLVGLEGERWFAFRRLVRRARSGGPIDLRDALRAYAMLIETRLRRDRLLG